MKRIPRRRVHSLFAVVTLALAAACSKSDAPPADSAAPTPAPQAASPLVGSGNAAAGVARKALPGDLTKPLDQYTGDEFYTLVQSLKYEGGKTRDRKCKDNPACSGTKRIKVDIDAVATQDSISAGTMPQFGVVYIRAINKGDATEDRYGMAPGKQYEYYLVLSNDSTGAMTWRLEQLDTTQGARRHASIGTGRFRGCNHPWTRGAKADFKTCAQSAAMHDSTVRLGLALQGAGDPPMWTDCSEGCCVADP